jgi:hypothetical protein
MACEEAVQYCTGFFTATVIPYPRMSEPFELVKATRPANEPARSGGGETYRYTVLQDHLAARDEVDAGETVQAGWWVRVRGAARLARPGYATVDGRPLPMVWAPIDEGTFVPDRLAMRGAQLSPCGARYWLAARGTADVAAVAATAGLPQPLASMSPGEIRSRAAIGPASIELIMRVAEAQTSERRVRGDRVFLGGPLSRARRVAGSYAADDGCVTLPMSDVVREAVDLLDLPREWWPIARGLATHDREFVEAARIAGGDVPPADRIDPEHAIEQLQAALGEVVDE